MPHPVNECIHVRRWVYCCSLCMDVCRVVGVRERDQAQLCAPGWGPSQLHYFTSTVSDLLLSEWVRRREGVVKGGKRGSCKREGGILTKWSLTDWVSEPRSDGEGRGRERDSSFSVCCSGAFPLVCSLLLEVEGDDVSRTNLSDGQTLSETFSPRIHPDRSSSSVLGFCAQHLDFLIFVCFTVERFQSLNIWHHKSVFSYPIQIKTRFLLKNKLYKTVRRNTG